MQRTTADVVLDASAVLAYIYDEPGADVVHSVLDHAFISSVNLAEVVTKLADYSAGSDDIVDDVNRLDLRVVAFDQGQAYNAGLLRRYTREAGLSLGDRACLALAQAYNLPALTSDRRWSEVTINVDIIQIR